MQSDSGTMTATATALRTPRRTDRGNESPQTHTPEGGKPLGRPRTLSAGEEEKIHVLGSPS
jgi:hypothetical protein